MYHFFKLLKQFIILIFFLSLISESLVANTYYVDLSGNNSNTGGFSAPWESIEYGASRLLAGDSLLIKEGIFTELFSIENIQGTESHPIVISGYNEERPIVDGNDLVPSLWDPLIYLKNCKYIIFKNIEVRNSRGTGIRIDENSHHISFSNIWLHYTGYDGIESENSNYLTIEDSKFWNTNVVNDTSSPWYEFFMWGGAIMASGDTSSLVEAAHDIIIRRNEIFQNFGEGINIFGHISGAVIENNTFWDNWAPSIFTPNSENILISSNLIYQTNDSRFLRDGNPGTGIGFLNEPPPTRPGEMKNITVINNLVMGCNRNFAFWNDEEGGPLQNVLIANNTFIDAHSNTEENEHSIYIADAENENVRFINNIILQEDNSASFGYSDNTGVSFSHNLWYPGTPPTNMQSSNDVYLDPLVSRSGSIEAGELLANYFDILENSPAIDSGTFLPEVTNDFLDSLRSENPTIGAFEYINTSKISELSSPSETLKVFPNPITSYVIIKNKNIVSSKQLSLHNMLAQKIVCKFIKISEGYFLLNTEQLSKGNYIISFDTKNNHLSKKIILEH